MAELLCWIELDCAGVPNKVVSGCICDKTEAQTKVNVSHWLAHVLHGCSGDYFIKALCSAAVFQLDRHTQARDPFSH